MAAGVTGHGFGKPSLAHVKVYTVVVVCAVEREKGSLVVVALDFSWCRSPLTRPTRRWVVGKKWQKTGSVRVLCFFVGIEMEECDDRQTIRDDSSGSVLG